MDTGFPLIPKLKVRLAHEGEPVLGPGSRMLLTAVQQCGSIHEACEQIGLSYSKGRRLLTQLEEALDCPLVDRSRGGAGGGRAALTPAGEWVLEHYCAFEAYLDQVAQEEYSRFFEGWSDVRKETT